MEKKRAAFAGSWYPEDADICKNQIDQFLAERNGPIKDGRFAGGIVPHAGWFFSGSIACRTIASIALSYQSSESASQPFGEKVDNELFSSFPIEKRVHPKKVDAVFIFGMHLYPGSPACIMADGAWQTPFGDILVHEELALEFIKNCKPAFNKEINIKINSPRTFPEENTIELQLPFIKYFFPDSLIVPIGVPPCDGAENIGAAAVNSAEKLGLNVVVIGSTDMTHYGSNYGFAPAGSGIKAVEWVKNENDPKAVEAICKMQCHDIIFQGLKNRNLCCAGAVSAAAAAAKKMGAAKGIQFDYATSYDKNPGAGFVGYSGILFTY